MPSSYTTPTSCLNTMLLPYPRPSHLFGNSIGCVSPLVVGGAGQEDIIAGRGDGTSRTPTASTSTLTSVR